jgi:hypothetical protein
LYSSPNITETNKSRRIRWAGDAAYKGDIRSAFIILVGKPEGKRPFGRLTRRWEDNIKMALKEIESEGVYWIHLAQDRDWRRAVLNAVMKFRVP